MIIIKQSEISSTTYHSFGKITVALGTLHSLAHRVGVAYLIEAGLLEGAPGCGIHLLVDGGDATVHHLEVGSRREQSSLQRTRLSWETKEVFSESN